MIPLCLDENIALIPWSPLARGFLCGSRKQQTERSKTDDLAKKFYTEADLQVLDAVESVARSRGIPQAQVALSWLLHRKGVVAPIIGATKMKHLDDAVASLDVELTKEERKSLESPYAPHRVLGH